jgi:hypothetical protein
MIKPYYLALILVAFLTNIALGQSPTKNNSIGASIIGLGAFKYGLTLDYDRILSKRVTVDASFILQGNLNPGLMVGLDYDILQFNNEKSSLYGGAFFGLGWPLDAQDFPVKTSLLVFTGVRLGYEHHFNSKYSGFIEASTSYNLSKYEPEDQNLVPSSRYWPLGYISLGAKYKF